MRGIVNSLGYDVVRLKESEGVRRLTTAERKELQRLAKVGDRPAETYILGPRLKLVSAKVFGTLYREIFVREIYRFQCKHRAPFILDCGANIGLACIYFKRLYESARVICFEPERRAYDALCSNVEAFGLKGVELRNAAVWTCDGEARLWVDRQSTASRILLGADADGSVESIKTIRLRDMLNQDVAFLKMDIEGAEAAVLQDCGKRLCHVEHLFVEYHSQNSGKQELDAVATALVRAGFRMFVESGGPRRQSPFVESRSHKGFDNLANIYCSRRKEG